MVNQVARAITEQKKQELSDIDSIIKDVRKGLIQTQNVIDEDTKSIKKLKRRKGIASKIKTGLLKFSNVSLEVQRRKQIGALRELELERKKIKSKVNEVL